MEHWITEQDQLVTILYREHRKLTLTFNKPLEPEKVAFINEFSKLISEPCAFSTENGGLKIESWKSVLVVYLVLMQLLDEVNVNLTIL